MTAKPPVGNTCGSCKHFGDLSDYLAGDGCEFPSSFYGECENPESDHCGHVMAYSHADCDEVVEKEAP